jgi:hypothetical protein
VHQLIVVTQNPKVSSANTKLIQDVDILASEAATNCTAEVMQQHTCHATLNYRDYKGDVNTLTDALAAIDPSTKICWINQVNQGTDPIVAGMANVTWYFKKSGYYFVPAICTAQDRTILLNRLSVTECATQQYLSQCNATFMDKTCNAQL